tara:strand:+ start:490 stop:1476 length:987 start_codon:yes stop_codon:yes gene_type:complete
MSEEKSSLVEEVTSESASNETKENTESFNPLAFASDTPTEGLGPDTPTTDEDDKGQPVTNEDGWKWEKNIEEEETESEESYDWEAKSEEEEDDDLDWGKVAKQLGMPNASKEEIRQTMKAMNSTEEVTKEQEVTSPEISTLQNYLDYSNKELVIEELKADGLTQSEIDDTVDKMQRNGLIAIKGREIKRNIKGAIKQAKENLSDTQQQNVEEKNKKISEAREGLQGHLKEMDRFMGGKVTKKQKEEVYRFATKDMANELWKSHANVADVAMFLLYKDQIKDILRSQGRNEGSKSLMDSIQSPNLNNGKSRNPYQPKGDAFDPKAFMSE